MLTHAQVWTGIDELARRYALTASGLAKLAGLDPTTFNRSKRFSSSGDKPRWPSTESIAKVLEATGATFEEFAAMAAGGIVADRRVPLIGFAQAALPGAFDEAGHPAGAGWDEASFPGAAGDEMFAVEIAGDALEPVYRDGDRIIVAPGQPVRRGDRVVVKLVNGEVAVSALGRITARRIELVALNPARPARAVDVSQIAWIARIVWASQ